MSTTTPAPSWPRIAGNNPSGSAPERVNSSVWQIPVALISTSTSPAFGPSSRTVSTVSGAPALCATAARTSILFLSGEFGACPRIGVRCLTPNLVYGRARGLHRAAPLRRLGGDEARGLVERLRRGHQGHR